MNLMPLEPHDPDSFEPTTPSMNPARRSEQDENEYLFFADELDDLVDLTTDDVTPLAIEDETDDE